MKHAALLITICLCLNTVAFLVSRPVEAAPTTPRNRTNRLSATDVAPGLQTPPTIELVSATSQGVTIQLLIAESDFEIGTQIHAGKRFQTLSFPGCRFTTATGVPRLPVQSTLIGVPPDIDFELQVVKSDFSTHSVQTVVSTSIDISGRAMNRTTTNETVYAKNHFFPHSIAEIRAAGWIRENRVLPIQLNPVQYNPVSGEVRLYHTLVVEVRFSRLSNAPSAMEVTTPAQRKMHGFARPESAVYEQLFENLLINPQIAKQWRSLRNRFSVEEEPPVGVTNTTHPDNNIPSAPPGMPTATPRYKVFVTEEGMYHITALDMRAAGIDITAIQPATLMLSSKGKQIPIFVRGEGDGKFDAEDEIVFYGQRHAGETSYINPFSDENVYWLSWNAGRGLRMATKTPPANTSNAQVYDKFLTRVHFEKDKTFRRFPNANLNEEAQQYEQIGQGLLQRFFTLTTLPALPNDSWFWELLTAPESKAFPFNLTGVAETDRFATLRLALHGKSNTEHHVQIWLNDARKFEDAKWLGATEYQFENAQILQSFLKNGGNTMRITTPGIPGALLDILLVNWFEIEYWRTFEAEKNVLSFSITPSLDETRTVNPNFSVWLENFSTPDIEIYGVDGTRYVGLDPIIDEERPGRYRVVFESSHIHHNAAPDTTIQYIALTPNEFRKPKIIADAPSDLRATHNAADYIIITDTQFIPDVQPLVNLREQQGMRTKVVDVQNIYDEFNHGILNPHAIREFLNYAYQNWQPPAPTYVFLVGDTHFDMKNKINFVPTIQVQIPGYGATASDHQFVTFRGTDSFPDMLIGRVPSANRVDARIFVERTIDYETNAEVGPWHKRLLMLAGSDGRFHSQTDRLIEQKQLNAKYETKPIYAPATAEPTLDDRVRSPVARQVIDGFNDGTSLVNYIGHGGGGYWSSTGMLDLEDPEQNLTNIAQLPFVISMTCFTGYFNGNRRCLAESLLHSQNGGAVAVIGGTSIGLLDGDYILNQEIFEVIFEENTENVGAILAEAKTQFLINAPRFFDLNEVFTLFGDPATRLRLPRQQMQVTTEVIAPSERDAFQKETLLAVSGTLPNPNFNGNAEITVVPTALSPTEASHEPYSLDRALARETVPVANGKFNTQIRLPSDSEFDAGNIQVYAWNADEDAIGYIAYAALQRYVNNIRLHPYPVEPEQPVHLYAEVVNQSTIDAMTLYWSWDGVEFYTIPVVQHTGSTYRSVEPIPGYPQWDLVDYYLEVKVKGGQTLQTPLVTYTVGQIDVDLAVLEQTITWALDPPFLLSAQIRNRETRAAQNVPVQFFQTPLTESGLQTPATAAGTPGTTTYQELQNATQIGETQVLAEVPPNSDVVVSVPWQPPPGKYRITVFVDLPSAEQPEGSIIEQRERNNSASREFVSNRTLLTPENLHQPIQSIDGVLRIHIPPGSLQKRTVMTFEAEALTITNQPDLAPLTGPSEQFPAVGYQFNLSEQTELTATATFVKPTDDKVHLYMHDEETGNWIRVGKETTGQREKGKEDVSVQVKLPGTFALLANSDTTPPTLDLTVAHQGFVDGDYVSDTPTISARIEDANGIDSRPENIRLTKNGERVPQDEYTIAASPVSSNLLLITYTPVLKAGDYRIRLQAQDANGNEADTERSATVAGEFEIKNIANFPNPFSPGRGTDFAYYLTESADEVNLKIYTFTGRLITAIDTLNAAVSYNEYHYDGLDAEGEPLANGVYLYKFTARKDSTRKQKVGKIVVLK